MIWPKNKLLGFLKVLTPFCLQTNRKSSGLCRDLLSLGQKRTCLFQKVTINRWSRKEGSFLVWHPKMFCSLLPETFWAQKIWATSCPSARASPAWCRPPWTRPPTRGASRSSELKCKYLLCFGLGSNLPHSFHLWSEVTWSQLNRGWRRGSKSDGQFEDHLIWQICPYHALVPCYCK